MRDIEGYSPLKVANNTLILKILFDIVSKLPICFRGFGVKMFPSFNIFQVLFGVVTAVDQLWELITIANLILILNIAFAIGGAHLPIAHALRLLSTKELRFGLTKLNLRKRKEKE